MATHIWLSAKNLDPNGQTSRHHWPTVSLRATKEKGGFYTQAIQPASICNSTISQAKAL